MDGWKRFGGLIGAHMPSAVCCCVLLGVLFPEVFSPLDDIVPLMFAFMTFQGSLSNTTGRLFEVLRKPLSLSVIMLCVLVCMPLLAFALGSLLFNDNAQIITGLVLGYSIPVGIVSFMWIGMLSGNGALGLAAILVSTVVSPFTIPLTLQILLGESVRVDVSGMITDMIFMIAAPALAGMAVNDLTKGWGSSVLSTSIAPLSKILLLLIITCNATNASPYVMHLTWERAGAATAVLLLTTLGFACGTVAARALGCNRDDAVTMGYTCGLRNISSGMVLATRYFPGEAVFPVMCGTLFQQILAGVYGKALNRMSKRQRAKRLNGAPGDSTDQTQASHSTGIMEQP